MPCMIAMISVPSAGNALRVILAPPPGALACRVLRTENGVIPASVTDPAGTLVFDSGQMSSFSDVQTGFLDTSGLINATPYTYTPFYQFAAGGAWQAASSQSASPQTQVQEGMLDVLTLLRERVNLGLRAYIAGGALQPASGEIPVLIASPAIASVTFPLVTLHLSGDQSVEHFIGDEAGNDYFDGTLWHTYAEFLSNVSVTLIAWSQSVDERVALREALKAILMQNLPVFSAAGLSRIDIQFSDQDDMESFSAPVYQAIGTLTALAPSMIERTDLPVTDVAVSFTTYGV